MNIKIKTYNTVAMVSMIVTLLFPLSGFGQKQVQVVTRNIDRELDFVPGETLVMMAEKASVEVSHWDKKYIQLNIKLISRHVDVDIAKRELDYLDYDISKGEQGYIVKNYFNASGKVRKVKGNLLAAYILKIPYGCDLDITNLYGSVKLSNLNSNLKGQFKFVDLKLIDHKGKGNIESYFGDVLVKNYSGKLTGKLEKSDLRLVAFNGKLDIDSNYGEIEVDGGVHENININGNRTKITFVTPKLESYNYAFKNTLGDIDLPSTVTAEKKSTQEGLSVFNRSFKSDNGMVQISTSYSSIILKAN